MPTTLSKNRQKAFHRQSGLCFYCGNPMWISDADRSLFLKTFHLTKRQGRLFQCSAEHLQARIDGGGNSLSNIAAAHVFCNRQRHRLKIPLPPSQFKQYVSRRALAYRWPTAKLIKH